MDAFYMWEKFHNAVLALATSNADIRKRIESALLDLLVRIEDPDSDLPPDIALKFRQLVYLVTAGESFISKELLAALTDDEARDVAERLVAIFSDVARWYGSTKRPPLA